jgi:hypothetical protein
MTKGVSPASLGDKDLNLQQDYQVKCGATLKNRRFLMFNFIIGYSLGMIATLVCMFLGFSLGRYEDDDEL